MILYQLVKYYLSDKKKIPFKYIALSLQNCWAAPGRVSLEFCCYTTISYYQYSYSFQKSSSTSDTAAVTTTIIRNVMSPPPWPGPAITATITSVMPVVNAYEEYS